MADRVMVVRCPEVCAAPPGDRAAAQAFERVVAAVTDLCPLVEAVEPGVCAFAARGPARYFGGETALAAQIIAALADIGVPACIGAADGLFAAQLAARTATDPSPAHPSPSHPSPVGTSADPAGDHPVLIIPPGRTAEFLAGQPVSV